MKFAPRTPRVRTFVLLQLLLLLFSLCCCLYTNAGALVSEPFPFRVTDGGTLFALSTRCCDFKQCRFVQKQYSFYFKHPDETERESFVPLPLESIDLGVFLTAHSADAYLQTLKEPDLKSHRSRLRIEVAQVRTFVRTLVRNVSDGNTHVGVWGRRCGEW